MLERRPGHTGAVSASSGPTPVEITVEGGEARAALSGEFDMNATFTVEPALERLLQDPGLDHVTVDLSGLEFIDSTGMGVLMRLQAETGSRGIELTLIPGPMRVQRVFETAGLLDALPFAGEAR